MGQDKKKKKEEEEVEPDADNSEVKEKKEKKKDKKKEVERVEKKTSLSDSATIKRLMDDAAIEVSGGHVAKNARVKARTSTHACKPHTRT